MVGASSGAQVGGRTLSANERLSRQAEVFSQTTRDVGTVYQAYGGLQETEMFKALMKAFRDEDVDDNSLNYTTSTRSD